jgi:hypothetical protein
MKNQDYKSHRKWVPAYHFVTTLGLLALLIGAAVNLYKSSSANVYSASLILLIAVLLMFIFLFARTFALKAQDRAIKAEENFRHFMLTQKPLPANLGVQQVVGLRFASDEEFPALAAKAASENMSIEAIKKSIKTWRPDLYRV